MYERLERCFKIGLYPFTKICFRKTFVLYVTVRLVRIWTYKNADEKEHTVVYHGEEKKDEKWRKADEKREYCVNTPSRM